MGHFSEQNFYEILEVSPEATAEEIQKAFFKAKATYSPNSPALYSVFTEQEAKELLKLIDDAYAILSNHTKRREYDKSLFSKSSRTSVSSSNVTALPTATDMATDLPDFVLPSESSTPLKSSATTLTTNTPLNTPTTAPAKGYGKTIFSHYNVDDEFEKEIQAQTVFDGTFLQKVRLYKNISLDQLSETSRISRPYLLAVETNDFHSLPAPVYVRGFISAVAKLLSLNEKKTVESYMKLFKDSREK